MRARSLLSPSRSAEASTFSFCLPLSMSVCATRSSTVPNWFTSFAAVLSPTPGTPGMLSLVSPLRATKSRYCAGVMP